MASLQCLQDHAPTEGQQQDFVRPSYELPCDVAGCSHPAVIWLNPEEVRDYERGARVFWESQSFTTMRASDSGPERRPWDGLQAGLLIARTLSLALRRWVRPRVEPLGMTGEGELPTPLSLKGAGKG